ncbi:MAG: hypothetical protein RMA76_41955 [Deltaproteobacteria bacterium]
MRSLLLALIFLFVGCKSSDAKPAAKTQRDAGIPKVAKVKRKRQAMAKQNLARISTKPRTKIDRANAKSAIGMNLVHLDFVSTEWAFLDSVRTAGWWTSGTVDQWNDGRRIEKTEAGWPKKLASGQRASVVISAQEGGPMVLTYAGRGGLEIAGTEQPLKGLAKKKNRITFTAQPNQRMTLTIVETDPKDPIVDVRVYPKRYEERVQAGAVFHPVFLERLAPFSVLRFMDWQIINGTRVQRWEQRSDPRFYAQAVPAGVAYEYMVLLANTLKADPWLCIPHGADDAFVEKLATFLREELDPSLTLYIEYSNEVWHDHPAFTQAAYARERAAAAKLDKDPDGAKMMFQGRRSTEIMKIFERIFGTEHLVRVLGSQLGNHYAHDALVKERETRAHHDAIAIGVYFGHEVSGLDDLLKKDDEEKIHALIEKTSLPWTIDAIRSSTRWGEANDFDVIAYEGGQHLVTHPGLEQNRQVQSLLDRVDADPRMKGHYAKLLAGWKAEGGGVFVHFVYAAEPAPFGRFGALRSTGQPPKDAPKYEALLEFIEKNPRWW